MEKRRMFELTCDRDMSRPDTVRIYMDFEEAVWILRRIADQLEPGNNHVSFVLYGGLEDKGQVIRPEGKHERSLESVSGRG